MTNLFSPRPAATLEAVIPKLHQMLGKLACSGAIPLEQPFPYSEGIKECSFVLMEHVPISVELIVDKNLQLSSSRCVKVTFQLEAHFS